MRSKPAQEAFPRSFSRSYRLVEIDPQGRSSSETFFAPHDDEALLRAIQVGKGRVVELWLGQHLIRRWTDPRAGGRLQ